jgi:regulator of replication initiation timing
MELPQDFKPKGFWERPERTTGMIVAVALVIAAGTGLYILLPFIITLLVNTLTAMFLLGAVVVVISMLANRRFRTMLWNIYKSSMRWITSWWKTIDPIGILNNYVESLEDNVETMEKQIEALRAQMGALKNKITRATQKMKESLSIANEAKKQQKQAVFVSKTRMAGRRENSILTYSNLSTKMEMLYRILLKMRETCIFMIDDIKDQVEVATEERQMIKASYSAFRSALKVIKGDRDKKDMFDETMEYLADDYGRKLGEIENFMEMSGNFIDSIDIQNGVFEQKGLEMLEKWEKESESLLLGNEKKLLIAKAADPDDVINISQPVPERELVAAKRVKSEESYKKLFADN